jgi:mannose-6-phosphate isomerase-like protein (cupin superfamily)
VLDSIFTLPLAADQRGADGFSVRLLACHARAGMTHCSLEAGSTSRPVRHRAVDVLWYLLAGQADVWRSVDGLERVDRLLAGHSVHIAAGVSYQLRAMTDVTLLVVTAPPWPGPEEAIVVDGIWSALDPS